MSRLHIYLYCYGIDSTAFIDENKFNLFVGSSLLLAAFIFKLLFYILILLRALKLIDLHVEIY